MIRKPDIVGGKILLGPQIFRLRKGQDTVGPRRFSEFAGGVIFGRVFVIFVGGVESNFLLTEFHKHRVNTQKGTQLVCAQTIQNRRI